MDKKYLNVTSFVRYIQGEYKGRRTSRSPRASFFQRWLALPSTESFALAFSKRAPLKLYRFKSLQNFGAFVCILCSWI